MSITFDQDAATAAVRRAAETADAGRHSRSWFDRIARLSELCEASSRTHIAFLGTAILARTLADVDLHAIKPRHNRGNTRAFSARSLCHNVLVPLAVDLGFSLGATGREPLNNQPYFRMRRLDDGTPVQPKAHPAFDYLLKLVGQLQDSSPARARGALAAFVAERRRHVIRYADPGPDAAISPDRLLHAAIEFVRADSEGGRRAQAVVAGLMDAFAGPDRVVAGRVNDPSRRHPGDVCVRSPVDAEWDKAFEVRDKPVTLTDVQLFALRCLAEDVREAAVVAVDDAQANLDRARLGAWADQLGIGVSVFFGWAEFVEQALFWAGDPKPAAARRAARHVRDRLIEVEVSPEAVVFWSELTARPPAES